LCRYSVRRKDDAMGQSTETKLRARIDGLAKEVSVMRNSLAFKEAVLAELLAVLRDSEGTEPGAPKDAPSPQPGRPVVGGSIAEGAYNLLRERGVDLRGTEIAKWLKEKGYAPGSKTTLLALTLSALSRRRDLFEKVRRGRYRARASM
jgi:hypothetical protein